MAGVTGVPNPGVHDAEGIQQYAVQVGTIADAVANDAALTERIIAAVHAGRPADVEGMFKELGIPARVEIVPEGEEAGGTAGLEPRARTTTTTTVTVRVGIGPVSISVTFTKTKETK